MKWTFLLLLVFLSSPQWAFAESTPDNQTAGASKEADLYALFLDKWAGGSAQIIHVARTAKAPTAVELAEYAVCLKGFNLVEPKSLDAPLQLSQTSLARRSNVRFVDPQKWHLRDPDISMSVRKPTSKAVNDAFAAGLLTFSRTIFDDRRQVAVFTYDFVCGGLCGGSGGVIFDKTATGWKQRNEFCGGTIS